MGRAGKVTKPHWPTPFAWLCDHMEKWSVEALKNEFLHLAQLLGDAEIENRYYHEMKEDGYQSQDDGDVVPVKGDGPWLAICLSKSCGVVRRYPRKPIKCQICGSMDLSVRWQRREG